MILALVLVASNSSSQLPDASRVTASLLVQETANSCSLPVFLLVPTGSLPRFLIGEVGLALG